MAVRGAESPQTGSRLPQLPDNYSWGLGGALQMPEREQEVSTPDEECQSGWSRCQWFFGDRFLSPLAMLIVPFCLRAIPDPGCVGLSVVPGSAC